VEEAQARGVTLLLANAQGGFLRKAEASKLLEKLNKSTCHMAVEEVRSFSKPTVLRGGGKI
jgi:hypothetical protein